MGKNLENKEFSEKEELKAGDLVIVWDYNGKEDPIIAKLKKINKGWVCPYDIGRTAYTDAVKFESIEQYEKIRKGDF